MEITEKRKYKRLPIHLSLEVSSIFKQDNEKISGIEAQIDVFDISKAGIGFTTTSVLPVGYYFNATIEFESAENRLLTVVKILYSFPNSDDTYRYGCEFVGLAPIFDYVFEEYENELKELEAADDTDGRKDS